MDQKHLFYVAKVSEAAIGGNAESAVAYLRQFIDYLRASGEAKEAERLQRIVEKRPARMASLALAKQSSSRIPVDSESALTIADKELVEVGSVKPVLSDGNLEILHQFVSYIRESDRLVENGVGISPTMLLHGPPGTGKTLTARYLASELGLPLVTARSDGLISSYLGSTSKNVRRLFDFAMAEPCILFLDEFDAIAKKRDDSRELGELKRVVISLLQNIDALDKDHVLIAATNHDHLLDPAIWRRFTYRLKLDLPDASVRTLLLREFLGKHFPEIWGDALSRLSEGLSGAQIKIAAEDSIRAAVMRGASMAEPTGVIIALLRERGLAPMSRDDLIRHLRTADDRVFTEAGLGKLVGLSQPAIHKILHKEIVNG